MNTPSFDQLSHREFILVKNARQNNLKNLSVAIPQKKLIVITGVSGSGKSSLAFDTLYAEGQRRYVESLSAYIRQFLGKINKPAVDYIKGLSPAVAIQQKVNTSNPRSTVGTATEIYDYLKLLYARIGRTFSPVSGAEVKRHTIGDVVRFMEALPENTRIQILSPITKNESRTWKDELNIILQKGFSRIVFNNEVVKVEDILAFIETGKSEDAEFAKLKNKIEPLLNDSLLLVDRVSVMKDDDENRARMADSVQTAFFEGHGTCLIEVFKENEKPEIFQFSDKFELDGVTFESPSVNLFSFNNSFGACPACEGFGQMIGIDEEKVIPNKNLSVFEDAVAPWRGEKMSEWKNWFIMSSAKYDFPIHRAYKDLTVKEIDLLWNGNRQVEGISDFFKHVESKAYKIQYRVMLSRYKGKTRCMLCKGTRLRPEASYVKVQGVSINELVLKPIKDLLVWFDELKLSENDESIAKRILTEIRTRLIFLNDVGLSYLTLNRDSRSLSGGESQRIQIVTSLGSNLTGAMYILDEPSIGLHSKDTDKLIAVLRRLQTMGNSVIVVEHDEEIIRQADDIIDIGPFAGTLGGELSFQGSLEEMLESGESLTAKYLRGTLKIEVPNERRQSSNKLVFKNAEKNNLKAFDVCIPLNVMTVITGVSGSGKSTLVKEVIYARLKEVVEKKLKKHPEIEGALKFVERLEYIDQDPIGKSSRSNPVTYIKAFDQIRDLFAQQPLSRAKGYTPGFFSFNVEGGRCEMCKGEGFLTVEMQFMADVQIQCENCNGKRFRSDILEVTYNGKNISEVLDMTVKESLEFFEGQNAIVNAIEPLSKVGLDYLTLGQPSIHLSGGEAQRIKLATFLGKGNMNEPIIFFFDEPTTGLHFHDIHKLMESFQALIEKGHTVMIIEHNLDVIKCADYVVDLGPVGGEEGGYLLFEGTPEGLTEVPVSFTGQYLKEKLMG